MLPTLLVVNRSTPATYLRLLVPLLDRHPQLVVVAPWDLADPAEPKVFLRERARSTTELEHYLERL